MLNYLLCPVEVPNFVKILHPKTEQLYNNVKVNTVNDLCNLYYSFKYNTNLLFPATNLNISKNKTSSVFKQYCLACPESGTCSSLVTVVGSFLSFLYIFS